MSLQGPLLTWHFFRLHGALGRKMHFAPSGTGFGPKKQVASAARATSGIASTSSGRGTRMHGCARLEPCAAGITSSADFIFMTADTAEPDRGVAQGSCSALAIERPSETTTNFDPTSILLRSRSSRRAVATGKEVSRQIPKQETSGLSDKQASKQASKQLTLPPGHRSQHTLSGVRTCVSKPHRGLQSQARTRTTATRRTHAHTGNRMHKTLQLKPATYSLNWSPTWDAYCLIDEPVVPKCRCISA